METVTVTVPDGIYEGQEFTLEYKGQSLVVVCPDGCAGGDDINLQIEVPAGGGAYRKGGDCGGPGRLLPR